MNIRDYIFIKKAKSSNKIRILEVLGFESDITLFQSPEIIKNFETKEVKVDDVDTEKNSITSKNLSYEDILIENKIEQQKEKNDPDTKTFEPLAVTSQIKKIWTDIEIRRRWFIPFISSVIGIFLISSSIIYFINMRNVNNEEEIISNIISEDTNLYISQLPNLIDVGTDAFYSRYDISNASANLQVVETSLITYRANLQNREIENINEVNESLIKILQVVQKLDQLYTYRIMHSEILIYEDVLNIDENTNIDDLASKLSLIDSKSVLSLESLPDIEEFNDHKELLNSAILTAQDLHGRLVASLRNNENDVAQNLISAIKLNKKSDVDFFTKSLENFKIKNLNILKNLKDIP